MANMTCPTCGTRFDITETKSPPFCSSRCQRVDMNRWLEEENRLPVENPSEEDLRHLDASADEPEDPSFESN